MKFALFSDLHANRQATEAVWEHAQAEGFDRLVLLGDYVDYGADPAWVIEFVQQRVAEGAVAVRGNHDEAVVVGAHEGMHGQVQLSLNWTRQQVSAEQCAFLSSLPLMASFGDCLAAHANAHAPAEWGYIHGRMEAMRSLYATEAHLVFCGHMHEPCLYHLSGTGKAGEFEPVPGVAIPLSRARRWLAIPGSVGQPRDGNPAACYALYDDEQDILTFQRVPYDHEEAAQRIIQAGLPEMMAHRLHHGR